MQELGNLYTIVDAQTYQGINTQFGIQQFALFRDNPFVGLQQRVEVADEVGIDVQEDGIEVVVELLQLVCAIEGVSVRVLISSNCFALALRLMFLRNSSSLLM